MLQLILNPFYFFILIIFLLIISFYLKSKRRQRDIEKGIEKALKKIEKDESRK